MAQTRRLSHSHLSNQVKQESEPLDSLPQQTDSSESKKPRIILKHHSVASWFFVQPQESPSSKQQITSITSRRAVTPALISHNSHDQFKQLGDAFPVLPLQRQIYSQMSAREFNKKNTQVSSLSNSKATPKQSDNHVFSSFSSLCNFYTFQRQIQRSSTQSQIGESPYFSETPQSTPKQPKTPVTGLRYSCNKNRIENLLRPITEQTGRKGTIIGFHRNSNTAAFQKKNISISNSCSSPNLQQTFRLVQQHKLNYSKNDYFTDFESEKQLNDFRTRKDNLNMDIKENKLNQISRNNNTITSMIRNYKIHQTSQLNLLKR